MARSADNCPASMAECPHAHESAEIAVKKVFSILGVDVDRPESVEEFREDLRFGKRMRRAADKGFMVVIGVLAASAIGATWVGIVSAIRGH